MLQDDRVLYISLHRHDHGSFYPAFAASAACDVGEVRGRGFNVNIPWSGRGVGDLEYAAAFSKVRFADCLGRLRSCTPRNRTLLRTLTIVAPVNACMCAIGGDADRI